MTQANAVMQQPATGSKQGLFRESDGKLSMMRLVFFLWSIGGFVAWILSILKHGTMQDVPQGLAAIIATLAAGKAAQKFAEVRRRA